jgi:hypothetical protein
MRQLSILCVIVTALLCTGAVLAQSSDDTSGTVLYVQTDNYIVRTYGEYTNPVVQYWTKDQPNDKYSVWVDSIYEVAPQTSTPAPSSPNSGDYYTYQGSNISASNSTYYPVYYQQYVPTKIVPKDLKWNISYPYETASTVSYSSNTAGNTTNVTYTIQQQPTTYNISSIGYKNNTNAAFDWLQFRVWVYKNQTRCRIECYVNGYKWSNPDAYLVVNYKTQYNNAPLSSYSEKYPYEVYNDKGGYFSGYGSAYQYSYTPAPTSAPAPINPNLLYYTATPGNNISVVGGYDNKQQTYTLQYGHFQQNYYHSYSFGLNYTVVPTTASTGAPAPPTNTPVVYQQLNSAPVNAVATFALLAAVALLGLASLV